MSNQWSNGLCSCCNNFWGCVYGACCPMMAISAARSRLDGSDPFFNLLALSPCAARNIIREAYDIEGGCCWDILGTMFCCPCLTCQMYQEVQIRGETASAAGANDQQFTNGMCDCCKLGFCGCLYSFIFPCCALASARSEYDGSDWCFNCLCVGAALTRSVIREGYNIQGECIADVATSCCCLPCTVAQLMGEVKARGPVRAANKQVVPT